MTKVNSIGLSLATAMFLGMTGCSSGGDSSKGETPTDMTPTDVTNISGKAIDGYLINATVCLDLNLDGYCQIGEEPVASTKEKGAFTLEVTDRHKENYPEYMKSPLLVYDGYDVDTGERFIGKLKAPLNDGKAINISPLSTVVEAVMSDSVTQDEAEELVKGMLGLGKDVDLKADPIEAAKENSELLRAALKIQKTLEVLVEAQVKAGSTSSKNDLVEGLYKKLAEEVVANRELKDAVEALIDADELFDDAAKIEAKKKATVISGQIELIIPEGGTVADTAVIGTKIETVKQIIVVAVEEGSDIPDDAKIAEKVEEQGKIIGLKSEVDALLAPTLTADVADAKNLVNQLRETAVTFLDSDRDIADQTDTVAGKEFQVLTDNIQPAVEEIATSFEASATAMSDSLEAFNSSIDVNFKVIDAIKNRLTALLDQTEDSDSETDWKVEAGSDTLSHTYSKVGDTKTEVFTLNGESLTVNYNDIEEGVPTASGTMSLSGTGYDLTISSFSLTPTDAIFKASGLIEGLDSSSMKLTNLELAVDVDSSKKDIEQFSNIEAKFDGEIVSSGRTLKGSLALKADGSSEIDGSYTGLADEPTFVGRVVAKVDVSKIKEKMSFEESDYIDPNALVMVKFADGSESFKTSVTFGDTSWTDYEEDTDGNVISVHGFTKDGILTTQSGREAKCSFSGKEAGEYYTSWEHRVTCENSVTLKPYYTTGDGKITVDIDGATYTVDWAYTDFNGVSGYPIIEFMDDDAGMTYMDNNKLMMDGEELGIISNIEIHKEVDILESDFDIEFTGKITHGSKVIEATVGINNQSDTEIYAKAINFTDGTSFVKATELSLVVPKADFIEEMKKDDSDEDSDIYYDFYHHNYSAFENYTVVDPHHHYYEDNYDEDKKDLDEIISKLTVNNLALSVKDSDGKALTFNADVAYSRANDNNTSVMFDGTYAYRDTKFVGVIEADGIVAEEENSSGTFSVFGSIESKGFEPFEIVTSGVVTPTSADAYTLFTRGESYKLGLSSKVVFSQTEDTTFTVKLADSNGVVGTFESSEGETEASGTFADKDGNTLGSYGEESNGNSWEIKYSDDFSETIF